MTNKMSQKRYAMENDGGETAEVAKGDETARGNWSGKMDFRLSAIGYAVGLGNVWRFPYNAFANGGASFLIPYLITLVFAGLPLFFMEMAFGQFASLGPISVWNAVPFFKGLGWAMVIISSLTSIYYNMIIAYTLYYLFASFTSVLPWQDCRPSWQEYGCVNREAQNATVRNMTAQWCEMLKAENMTDGAEYIGNCTRKLKTPSEIYWEREVLDVSEGLHTGADEIRWPLALCLLLAWIIIFFCLIKGIKSSGKVVYFTATFPYVILLILLIRNVMLDGAWLGIKFYIIPEWERLLDIKVWYSAAVQIFYSLGVAFGGLSTMASYNKFKNNVYRDSLIVAFLNCSTSIFAGFVIFSVIGHMSFKAGVAVKDAAAGGLGLAFIAYPEGLAMMPIAPLWSILFFLMLFTLGLDSQFTMMETVITALVDEFPILKRRKFSKVMFTLALCVGMFLIGLPQCSRAGIYVMSLFDWYCAGFGLMLVSLLEVIAISYFYGYRRFCRDIAMMIGFEPNIYWKACWLVITPLFMLAILIFSILYYTPASYSGYQYPAWADGIGWGMVGLTVFFIPAVALFEYCRSHDFVQSWRTVMRPRPGWGPAATQYRTGPYAGNENRAYQGDDMGLSTINGGMSPVKGGFEYPVKSNGHPDYAFRANGHLGDADDDFSKFQANVRL